MELSDSLPKSRLGDPSRGAFLLCKRDPARLLRLGDSQMEIVPRGEGGGTTFEQPQEQRVQGTICPRSGIGNDDQIRKKHMKILLSDTRNLPKQKCPMTLGFPLKITAWPTHSDNYVKVYHLAWISVSKYIISQRCRSCSGQVVCVWKTTLDIRSLSNSFRMSGYRDIFSFT